MENPIFILKMLKIKAILLLVIVCSYSKCKEENTNKFSKYQSYIEESQNLSFLGVDNFSDFAGLSNINYVTASWKLITTIFKTKKWNIIKDRIPGQGFDNIVSKSVTDSIVQLEASHLDEYLEYFAQIVDLPTNAESRSGLLNSIKYTKYSKQKAFNGLNLSFTKEGGGSSYYILFFHRKNSDETIDIIYSFFKMDFSLAPDVVIMNKGLSVLGGLYSDEKEYLILNNRSLSDEDAQGILALSQMINYRAICTYLGITNLPWPSS